jgi:hypothetical protein
MGERALGSSGRGLPTWVLLEGLDCKVKDLFWLGVDYKAVRCCSEKLLIIFSDISSWTDYRY